MNGPLYLRIAEEVRNHVVSGKYRPGQALPPERELMERFAVSRVTVRRALKELVNESILKSRQGSGYIVQPAGHLCQPLNRASSFTEECLQRGLTPGSLLISRNKGKSNTHESTHFAVPPGTAVFRVKRIRTGDSEPLLFEKTVLLASNAPSWPWPEGSLYLAFQRAGLFPERIHQQYLPVLADKTLARHLGVDKGCALMLIIRAGFTCDDRPVEYSQCWFRADRWTFIHEIDRQTSPIGTLA